MTKFINPAIKDLLGFMSPETLIQILNDLSEWNDNADPDGNARRIEQQIANYAEDWLGPDGFEKVYPYLPKDRR